MVTITDIANKAGVAKSTVSNALTGKKFVSEPLKQKILAICEEMNFYPNFYASSLPGHHTNIIALFLEESESGTYHAYYTELIESCLKYVSKHGYNLLIYYNLKKSARQGVLRKGKAPIDGAIITAPMLLDRRILRFESDSIPCVSIGKPNASTEMSYVDVDNYKLVHDAVNVLALNGYETIYLINSRESLNISRERTIAFLDAMRESSLKTAADAVFYAENCTAEEGKRFSSPLMKRRVAFITANVSLAEGIYAAAAEAGLEIGQGVGVFALGGECNEKLTPHLTYASQDYARLAKMAASNLIRHLSAQRNGEAFAPETELIASKIHFDSSVNRG
jgi:DNA-binding LacI/PurR family transcriptional regulator